MNTITYYHRDRFGKFKSVNYRKLAKKVIFYQFFILGWVLALFFFRQEWNIRCAYNGQIHGWLVTKQDCDTAYQNWFTGTQTMIAANEQAILVNNPDLR